MLDFFLVAFVKMPAHTTLLPRLFSPSCADIPSLSFISGAIMSVTGLDRVFGGFGAPPAVHWALGGLAADSYCKGLVSPDGNTGMAMAAAYGGGFVTTMFFGGR